jgi:hypothetical protein
MRNVEPLTQSGQLLELNLRRIKLKALASIKQQEPLRPQRSLRCPPDCHRLLEAVTIFSTGALAPLPREEPAAGR